ncbi:MAG: methyltransferase domain-containing protein [Paracoccaceae bacterium]
MLKFDKTTTRLLDDAYAGADITRRRRASYDAVEPHAGEIVLDLGCGNGMLTLELSRGVGPEGRVVALDPSADMLKSARDRCTGRDNIAFLEARAEATGLPDASVDKAVSLQVFEYLKDLDQPLSELARVLKPGGRLVIGDMHWDSLIWHSTDPDRMAEMVRVWDRHLTRRTVPETLPAHLRRAGFLPVRAIPVPFLDTDLRPDGLASMMIRLMESYALQNHLLDPKVVEAWVEEQAELARNGEFFMHLLHVVWIAVKA